MRGIGLDVHRTFAQVAALEKGLVKDRGHVAMDRDVVLTFATTLFKDVMIEAAGNTAIIVRLPGPHVRRIALANPLQMHTIAWAMSRPTKLTPQRWRGYTPRNSCRSQGYQRRTLSCSVRRIAERPQLVLQMTCLKDRIQFILHANLVVPQGRRIYGKDGPSLLEQLPLPADQMRMALRQHSEINLLAAELAIVDSDLA
jgi:transposase